MNASTSAPAELASGERMALRETVASDVDTYVYWQTHGEWRTLDAPWDGLRDSLTTEEEDEFRERFLEKCGRKPPVPRFTATITARGGKALGWVNCYGKKRFPDTWLVGICIAEDEYLNCGIGTEVLELWVDYLFANSSIHRIGLDTWSLNPRMMRVAEKLGFTFEGAEREYVEWQGEYHDAEHYGMLRREWEEMRASKG